MPKAVKFNEYGTSEVLKIVEVPMPDAGDDQVVVKVKAAGINPGEAKIRDGALQKMFPATFPSGEGTDFAGIVSAIGSNVSTFKLGQAVAGYTHDRASHAEYVMVPVTNITPKPDTVSWEVAGSLYVAATTAYAAVHAINPTAEDTVIVSGACGGVGSIAAQYALTFGAKIYGIAGPHDQAWLKERGVNPVSYDQDVTGQLNAAGVTATGFIDTVGKDYVKLAIDLGIVPDMIDTVIDFAAIKTYGVKGQGSAEATGISYLRKVLDLIADGTIVVPIAKTFPLDHVKEAYEFLASEHHRGKVVLIP
jgi:NADPH:quinone reductase-like Zn-dependent oxidoreductase